MAWTNYQKFLALTMVLTGSINTLATSWADRTESLNSIGEIIKFNHPFLQACGMFLGELSCLIVFKICFSYYTKKNVEEMPKTLVGNQSFNPIIFLPPAMCDMIGTSIMYVGLNLTYPSSFQMLRGAVIVFTGLLSVAFLDRTLKNYEWLGIFTIILGLACVGMSDVFYPSKDTAVTYSRNSLITGDLLIIMAQIVVATQMVVEEKFVGKHNVPALQGVGWEGFFGFCTLTILLIPMYFIKVGNTIFDNPGGRLEDAYDGFVQMKNSWQVSLAYFGSIVSIAFFNFAGLSVTKEMSATTRMVLDSIRTFVVWIFSLAVAWQNFNYLQVIGFLVLFVGMCLYNDVIIRPGLPKIWAFFKRIREKGDRSDEEEPIFRSTDEEASSVPKIRSESIN